MKNTYIIEKQSYLLEKMLIFYLARLAQFQKVKIIVSRCGGVVI